jgi:DNA-binding transcriptional LysR family regulator
MDIKQLKTFLAVADAKSFLKAADLLFVTRQALAKTVDQLEDELGVELFFRTQKGAMMTPAGVYFYPRAVQIVEEFDKLKDDTVNMARSYRPKINICLSIGIYDYYATKIHEYRKDHSGEMQIALRCCLETDAPRILADRRADAVLSFLKPSDSYANTVKIGESEIVLVVDRKIAASDRSVGINELPKLLYNGGTEKPLWWDERPGKQDIISSDLNYLYSLLREGKGVLPMPRISIPSYLDFTMVLPVYPKHAPMPIYYSTLQPDYYNQMNYSVLEGVFTNVIAKKQSDLAFI